MICLNSWSLAVELTYNGTVIVVEKRAPLV